MNDSLRKTVLPTLIGILREFGLEYKAVILYGSVVRGEQSNYSDIDLLLILERFECRNLLSAMKKLSSIDSESIGTFGHLPMISSDSKVLLCSSTILEDIIANNVCLAGEQQNLMKLYKSQMEIFKGLLEKYVFFHSIQELLGDIIQLIALRGESVLFPNKREKNIIRKMLRIFQFISWLERAEWVSDKNGLLSVAGTIIDRYKNDDQSNNIAKMNYKNLDEIGHVLDIILRWIEDFTHKIIIGNQ